MIKAYSYLRFSTPEQGKGDSFRRQAELARNYAALNDLELDEEMQFHDYGISAFHGRNAKIGALKNFLYQVEIGSIEQNSYLLVESLDRISRDEILPALNIFLKIIHKGLTIVTLIDEKKYSKKAVNANPTDLLCSLLVMMRAREESETRSKRVKAYYAEKRERIKNDGERFRNRVPMWLTINKRTKSIEIIKERSEVIKIIYRMALKGAGAITIAKKLNLKGLKTFNGSEFWSSYNIERFLRHPAVTGSLVFGLDQRGIPEEKKIPVQEIKNYYPRIIDPAVFNKVQIIRKTKETRHRGDKGFPHHRGNVFSEILKCFYCGSSMHRHGKDSQCYLRCKSKTNGGGCESNVYARYDFLEDTLIKNIKLLISSAPRSNTIKIDEEIREISHRIDSEIKLNKALKSKARVSLSMSQTKRLSNSQDILDSLKSAQNELKIKRASTTDHAIKTTLNLLMNEVNSFPLNVRNVNGLLRHLFSSMVIDTKSNRIIFNWIQGGHTEMHYLISGP
jgi:DNA invertase Pin-like site-specific DNA recombinase